MAKQNFERFFDLRPGTSTQEQIDRSSLGATGWSSAGVRENQSVAQDRAHQEAHDELGGGGCFAFGAQTIDNENVQVAKLCRAGGDEAGKMAIRKAIAERHGVIDKEAPRKLASGEVSDEERPRVPGHLRGAMCEIGLHCAIAPINVMETL